MTPSVFFNFFFQPIALQRTWLQKYTTHRLSLQQNRRYEQLVITKDERPHIKPQRLSRLAKVRQSDF